MKINKVIAIALVLVFNDFVGALLREVGILVVKIGTMIASIPTIF